MTKENIIFPDEFERLLQLEKYDFNLNEIQSAFNYIDYKKDGFIDRIEFIQILRNIPHPITTIHNYFRNHKLTIDDIAYMIGYDIYNSNSDFYNDFCSPAFYKDNDIILKDRQKDFIDNNKITIFIIIFFFFLHASRKCFFI